MDNPTFHLEGVIRTREDMEDFEGPLTLILQLHQDRGADGSVSGLAGGAKGHGP